jgi:hypothetical protein
LAGVVFLAAFALADVLLEALATVCGGSAAGAAGGGMATAGCRTTGFGGVTPGAASEAWALMKQHMPKPRERLFTQTLLIDKVALLGKKTRWREKSAPVVRRRQG